MARSYLKTSTDAMVFGNRPVTPVQVGIISRLTEAIPPSGRSRMRIVSPHGVVLGQV